jgi:hypothetical protein
VPWKKAVMKATVPTAIAAAVQAAATTASSSQQGLNHQIIQVCWIERIITQHINQLFCGVFALNDFGLLLVGVLYNIDSTSSIGQLPPFRLGSFFRSHSKVSVTTLDFGDKLPGKCTLVINADGIIGGVVCVST